jgi:hypothetical protein
MGVPVSNVSREAALSSLILAVAGEGALSFFWVALDIIIAHINPQRFAIILAQAQFRIEPFSVPLSFAKGSCRDFFPSCSPGSSVEPSRSSTAREDRPTHFCYFPVSRPCWPPQPCVSAVARLLIRPTVSAGPAILSPSRHYVKRFEAPPLVPDQSYVSPAPSHV